MDRFTYVVFTGDDKLDREYNNPVKANTRAAELRRQGYDAYVVREERTTNKPLPN